MIATGCESPISSRIVTSTAVTAPTATSVNNTFSNLSNTYETVVDFTLSYNTLVGQVNTSYTILDNKTNTIASSISNLSNLINPISSSITSLSNTLTNNYYTITSVNNLISINNLMF